MESIYLSQIQTIKPQNCFSQTELSDWIIKSHQKSESLKPANQQMNSDTIEKLLRRYGVKENQIFQRYFECNDVFSNFGKDSEIYRLEPSTPNGVDVTARSYFFSEKSFDVLKKLYNLSEIKLRPDHLIHVTCTGYVSPSAAQKIVTHPDWNHDTGITHAYHMGCYAALPSIRLARGLLFCQNKRVDIVHNEMCGLHMNTAAQTPEQMIVQTLFADGHAKYTISKSKTQKGHNLRIIGICEKIVPDSEMDMSWVPGPWGMQMNLSRQVPSKIKSALPSFTEILFSLCQISRTQASNSIFAIHPGGPRIIDAVQETLHLSDEQIKQSRQVLLERGNMSSATLPHVWEEILNCEYPSGTTVVSFAFGPGLTLFGSVFEVC